MTNQLVLHIDATPDEDYPLRILRAYRLDCNYIWSSSIQGKGPDSPFIRALNEIQAKRAEILDRAIAALEAVKEQP